MKEPPARGVRGRIVAYRVALAAIFAVLAGQLWRLQMVEGDYYREAADLNRYRLEASSGPRGVIYDRWGHLLARNTPRTSVALIPAYLPEYATERLDLLRRLARLLAVPLMGPVKADHAARPQAAAPDGAAAPDKPLLDVLRAAELAPYRPVTVKADISRYTALVLEE